MAKRGRPAKGEFDDLDKDFQDKAAALKEQELRDLVALTAMNEAENIKNMKEDQHLKECKDSVKEASAQYRNATKQNALKIRFMKRCLEDKGKPTTSEDLTPVES